MKDIREKLLATFQIEHRDHVEQIRSLLAMIEKTAVEPGGPQLEEAFRRAHSLKGAARAVDLHPVEGLAHRLETLFSRVRQGVLLLLVMFLAPGGVAGLLRSGYGRASRRLGALPKSSLPRHSTRGLSRPKF